MISPSIFSIRYIADNSIVDINQVDTFVKNEFEADYLSSCDVIIPEDSKVTWTKLVHAIVYYSEIPFGRCTKYNFEAAFEWVRLNAILFHEGYSRYISKLWDFLESKGYYIFCNFHRDDERERNIYGKGEQLDDIIIKNQEGLFFCRKRFGDNEKYNLKGFIFNEEGGLDSLGTVSELVDIKSVIDLLIY